MTAVHSNIPDTHIHTSTDTHIDTHTAPAPQDMANLPKDSRNTNTLRHMTHALTSSATKDFQSFACVNTATEFRHERKIELMSPFADL